MSDSVLDDIMTPEQAVRNNVRCICLVLDDDVVEGLQRLKETLPFPVGCLVSESLRQSINIFLPLAGLCEQGKVASDGLPDVMRGLESLIIKNDVAKSRLDKKLKKMDKQRRLTCGVKDDGKGSGTS